LQPKNSTWSAWSKGAPITAKKESWRDWKVIQEKKKKKDVSSDSDTSKGGVVHAIGIATVVSTKSWASVVSSDDDDELLPSLGSTSLAKSKC